MMNCSSDATYVNASPHSDLSARPLLWRQHEVSEVEEHQARLQGWLLRYEQLGAGNFGARFVELCSEQVQLFREVTTQSVRQQGALGEGRLGIGFMRRSRGAGALNGWSFSAREVLISDGQDLDMRTPARCDMVGIVLAPELLPRDADQHKKLSARVLTQDSVACRRLRNLVTESLILAHRIKQQRRTAPASDEPYRLPFAGLAQWREDLVDASQAVLEESVESLDLHRARLRSDLVHRACARMQEQLEMDQCVSQTTLCRELGVSQRKLNYTFQMVLGLSPHAWLRITRLNAVRRHLKQGGGEQIYDIATRYGFWHFGHFSAAYRDLFGERPTDTTRRAGGRCG